MQFNREIISAVVEELSAKLGRPAEEILAKGLSAYDFSADGVEVVFEDGSSANFNYAFHVENTNKNLIAVFTEHCGYHLFRSLGATVMIVPDSWVEIDEEATYCCERFKEAVCDGQIKHADDITDETEWYLPKAGHIYFCPFCGNLVKGEGFGTYDKEIRKPTTD